jgi:hypothetical protein
MTGMILIVLFVIIVFWWWWRSRRNEEKEDYTATVCPPGTSWSVALQMCKVPINKCPPGTYSGSGKPPCLKCKDGKCPKHITF